MDENVQWAARLLSVPCLLADRVLAAMNHCKDLPSRRVSCLAKFPVMLFDQCLTHRGMLDMYFSIHLRAFELSCRFNAVFSYDDNKG